MTKVEENNTSEVNHNKRIGNIVLLLASGEILLHMISRLSTILAIGVTSLGLAQHNGK
jgi:hypothetical protein